MTEEEIVEFIREHVKPDKDTVNFDMTKSERNISLTISSGIDSECILAVIAKLDFKESKKFLLDKPLYCRPLRNLTPTKPNAGEINGKSETSKKW